MKIKFSVSLIFLISLYVYAAPASHTGRYYYVDSNAGDDRNTGLSIESPWKTIRKLNSIHFSPGDTILLCAGALFSGRLAVKGSGTADKPIVLSSYGEGPLPVIAAAGQHSEALLLKNCEFWEVTNLEITNTHPKIAERRYGIRVASWNFGTMDHIYLKDLYIHDVSGDIFKKDRWEGHGILWENGGRLKRSNFNDLRIENCRLERTDRTGIGGSSPYRHKSGVWFPSTNVVIRNNYLEDIGGDGIKVFGCDGALVEYNIVKNASQRNDGYCCGIWPFASDNTIIQYNEVSGMRGTVDGYAFDADFDTRNTLFQYNYSHDNEGGFMFVFTPRPSEHNEGTIVRYNISVNDGTRIFSIGGPVKNVQIYNNSIITGEGMVVQSLLISPAEHHGRLYYPDDISIKNNIFLTRGIGQFVQNIAPVDANGLYTGVPGIGETKRFVLESNLLFGNNFWVPATGKNFSGDPMITFAQENMIGYLAGLYTLENGSPCIGTGLYIEGNGGKDFAGNDVEDELSPDIGAVQYVNDTRN
ncbi:MAG: right-handed parallel beta-helix repeat-containing protein [Candidatus Latescibacteria bacterium]|nr:right-handed parallel beta-helix repeat-containing protein [Candidatus Latescibacterota bacterium]